MDKTETANQTTRGNLAALSKQLVYFVTKFNGIAEELKRSTDTIGVNLDSYNIKTLKHSSGSMKL